jgi:predicted kinase
LPLTCHDHAVYVVVTGLPGSGKSTLARPLATALGWPLLAKDAIKETLWDTLGDGDSAWARRLGAASMEVLWAAASDAPDAVIDAFAHHEQRPRVLALRPPVLEVHCSCPPELARSRYAGRRRHPCHFDGEMLANSWDRWVATDAEPVGTGEVIPVDTTNPVDVDALATRVRSVGVTAGEEVERVGDDRKDHLEAFDRAARAAGEIADERGTDGTGDRA